MRWWRVFLGSIFVFLGLLVAHQLFQSAPFLSDPFEEMYEASLRDHEARERMDYIRKEEERIEKEFRQQDQAQEVEHIDGILLDGKFVPIDTREETKNKRPIGGPDLAATIARAKARHLKRNEARLAESLASLDTLVEALDRCIVARESDEKEGWTVFTYDYGALFDEGSRVIKRVREEDKREEAHVKRAAANPRLVPRHLVKPPNEIQLGSHEDVQQKRADLRSYLLMLELPTPRAVKPEPRKMLVEVNDALKLKEKVAEAEGEVEADEEEEETFELQPPKVCLVFAYLDKAFDAMSLVDYYLPLLKPVQSPYHIFFLQISNTGQPLRKGAAYNVFLRTQLKNDETGRINCQSYVFQDTNVFPASWEALFEWPSVPIHPVGLLDDAEVTSKTDLSGSMIFSREHIFEINGFPADYTSQWELSVLIRLVLSGIEFMRPSALAANFRTNFFVQPHSSQKRSAAIRQLSHLFEMALIGEYDVGTDGISKAVYVLNGIDGLGPMATLVSVQC